MKPTPDEVQKALDFLAWLRRADEGALDLEALPASIDYDALAALARRSGFDAPGHAIAEAFRTLMRVRALAASRRSPSRSS